VRKKIVKAEDLLDLSEEEWQVLFSADLGERRDVGSLRPYLEVFHSKQGNIVEDKELTLVWQRQTGCLAENFRFRSSMAAQINSRLKYIGFGQYVIRVASAEGRSVKCRRTFRFGKLSK